MVGRVNYKLLYEQNLYFERGIIMNKYEELKSYTEKELDWTKTMCGSKILDEEFGRGMMFAYEIILDQMKSLDKEEAR